MRTLTMLALMLLFVLQVSLTAFVSAKIIGWYMVPAFPALAAITTPIMLGATLLFSLVLVLTASTDEKDSTDGISAISSAFARIFVTLFVAAVAFILR